MLKAQLARERQEREDRRRELERVQETVEDYRKRLDKTEERIFALDRRPAPPSPTPEALPGVTVVEPEPPEKPQERSVEVPIVVEPARSLEGLLGPSMEPLMTKTSKSAFLTDPGRASYRAANRIAALGEDLGHLDALPECEVIWREDRDLVVLTLDGRLMWLYRGKAAAYERRLRATPELLAQFRG